jgi:probable rRNA maturation factor
MDVLWRDRRVVVEDEELKRLVALVSEGERRRFDVSLVVTDDADIRRVNRDALGHDYETDVVTFDLGEPGAAAIEGEIVVSAEHAARAATEAGHDAATELLFYVCHGLLHLSGHDDARPEERAAMLARQAEYLAALGRTVRG